MYFLVLLTLSLICLFTAILPTFVTNYSQILHQTCLNWAPNNSIYQEVYQALLCGQKIQEVKAKSALIHIGLYHLFVVSGAHLIFLEQLLDFITRRLSPPWRKLSWLLLILFATVNRWQAPIARAFVAHALRQVSRSRRWHWRGMQICAVSVLLCLILQPEWLTKKSFQLSWAAAIALQIPAKSTWHRGFWLYIFLFPFLSSFLIPHPIAIVTNALLIPIIGPLLLPLAGLAYLPFGHYLSDPVLALFAQATQGLDHLLAVTPQSLPWSEIFLWCLLFGCHIFAEIRIWQKRF